MLGPSCVSLEMFYFHLFIDGLTLYPRLTWTHSPQSSRLSLQGAGIMGAGEGHPSYLALCLCF